ncbi:hypothetical protein OF83DRAFT_1056825 [Amylostereum chailletii]|nr:hypothetical protein OF83DRAFT_1056825 [Amylostereum chailletii]
MVPAHPFNSTQPQWSSLFHLVLLFLLALHGAQPVLGQFLVNGQVFTAALAIVDAPAPQSVYHAGSNIPIAIDVSGDGKLGQGASVPGSGLSTHLDSLELYLISTQTGINVTVSSGTDLLTQEPSSTVKHMDFQLSHCVPAGSYNFTIYEGSRINNTDHFSISAIPVSVENTAFNGTCTEGINALQTLPQASSPPLQQPFIDTSTLTLLDVSYNNEAHASSTQAGAQTVTLTLQPTGYIISLSVSSSSNSLSNRHEYCDRRANTIRRDCYGPVGGR